MCHNIIIMKNNWPLQLNMYIMEWNVEGSYSLEKHKDMTAP